MNNNNNNGDNRPLFQLTKEELMQDFEQVVRKIVNQMQVEQVSKDEKLALTRDETAGLLHVSLGTLNNWDKQGILKPSGRIGKRVYYSKEDVLAKLKGE